MRTPFHIHEYPIFQNPHYSNQSLGGACIFRDSVWSKKIYPCHSRSQQWLMLNIKEDTEASLENSVDNVATDGGTCAKDSGIAHLLAEFLALLLQFAVLATLRTNRRPGLG